MHPTLKSLKISKLFGYKNIEINFNPVTVIVGKNGLGKTTILKILNALLKQEHCNELDLCSSAELTFSNNEKIAYNAESNHFIIKDIDFENIILATLKKSEKFNSRIIEKLKSDIIANMFSNDDIEDIESVRIIINKNESHHSKLKIKPFTLSDEIKKFIVNDAKISYISTINMNANSQQNITGSDGEERNFLDYEIEREIKIIEFDNQEKHTKLFIKKLNSLYKDSGKKVKINTEKRLMEIKGDKHDLTLKHLSSGERQLMYILAKVANTKGAPTFLLMDEPEISLHLHWQENILDSIKAINPLCQIVVVTHSPAIIMNGYMDSYVEMKDITTDGERA